MPTRVSLGMGQGTYHTALRAEGLGDCDRCKRPLAEIDPRGVAHRLHGVCNRWSWEVVQADALDSSEPLPTWGLSNPSSCGLTNTILASLHSPSLVL